MLSPRTPAYGVFDCDFGFDYQEWSCSSTFSLRFRSIFTEGLSPGLGCGQACGDRQRVSNSPAESERWHRLPVNDSNETAFVRVRCGCVIHNVCERAYRGGQDIRPCHTCFLPLANGTGDARCSRCIVPDARDDETLRGIVSSKRICFTTEGPRQSQLGRRFCDGHDGRNEQCGHYLVNQLPAGSCPVRTARLCKCWRLHRGSW